ncbi:hypothetical protein CSOJ01_00446 [Colletotrichum sojae]|uniref:Uncharacterized protein n=1 Tax=Colletotrichum sojae TaxID=2175907 RepID=A0A8H6N692_9PEZI|nr:hypothetical protein CSOJ01_00446 [Colletotrichum sojae]
MARPSLPSEHAGRIENSRLRAEFEVASQRSLEKPIHEPGGWLRQMLEREHSMPRALEERRDGDVAAATATGDSRRPELFGDALGGLRLPYETVHADLLEGPWTATLPILKGRCCVVLGDAGDEILQRGGVAQCTSHTAVCEKNYISPTSILGGDPIEQIILSGLFHPCQLS